MLKTAWLIAILCTFGSNANISTAYNMGTVEGNSDTSVRKGTKHKSLEGYWILSNYIDSILKDKSIAKHRIYPIAWSAMAFKIQNDSLYSNGILYFKDKIKIQSDNELLGVMSKYGKFALRYIQETDCIDAMDNSAEENYYLNKGKHFTYRRVTEKRLLDIFENQAEFNIRKGFYQLFIDSLIAGEYTSLTNGEILSLYSEGSMKGFKNFNKYRIHDYFGTSHPFQNYDVIDCIDSNATYPEINASSPDASSYYNWTFTGDTLRLTEMMTKDDDEYYLGTKTYTFLRKKYYRYKEVLSFKWNILLGFASIL